MRTVTLAAALVLAAVPAAAQQSAKADTAGHRSAPQSAETGKLPAGWTARLDRNADLSKVKFGVMEPGYHITLGPAGIFWREGERANGPFHAVATIHQTSAPTHPEGYGLFYGGQALTGEGQKYTYFLIRGDGTFLIKERNGAETKNITEGWVEHAAVKAQNAEGAASNKLEIDAMGDQVRFLVNGQAVHSMAAAPGSRNGIIGLRINHNLDVHVQDFEVHQQ